MPTAAAGRDAELRYEAGEEPSYSLSFGLGFQHAMLSVASLVLTPVIVIRGAGLGDPYLSWAVFAALVVSGTTTALQAVRLGRIGAGYILLMGTSGAFIAVCVTALTQGGPGMLATLIVASSLFQFAIAGRLSWLRRIITPSVAGTVIMLIPVTVMPIVFDLLTQVPEGTSPAAAPTSAAVTLAAMVVLALRATGAWRLWAPVLGAVAGCIAASAFGIYDFERVLAADWFGVPVHGWPGFDLSFSPQFWALLPAFVFVTLVGAIETIGDSVAVQKISWRRPRAVDFRAVQGAVAADGLGNLLSGLGSTVPNTTYSSGVSVIELTGVAARRVGVCIGIFFFALAFLPKLTALLLAIPNPVAAAYTIVLLAILFVLGMKIVVQDGVDYRKATVVGVAFWIGVGFQNQAIFHDSLGGWWGSLLGNGMTAGGLAAMLLTAAMHWPGQRRRRIETALAVSALTPIEELLRELASRRGWSAAAADRLCSAAEESLLTLIRRSETDGEEPQADGRRLLLIARSDTGKIELEFIAGGSGENLEDRMALLAEPVGVPAEEEISLRLLRHFASSVRHQQYHGSDIVTVVVEKGG